MFSALAKALDRNTEPSLHVAILSALLTMMLLGVTIWRLDMPAPSWFFSALGLLGLAFSVGFCWLITEGKSHTEGIYIVLSLSVGALVTAMVLSGWDSTGEFVYIEVQYLILVYLYFLSPLALQIATFVAFAISLMLVVPAIWLAQDIAEWLPVLVMLTSFNIAGFVARQVIDGQFKREKYLRDATQELADKDQLTGLVKRRVFYESVADWRAQHSDKDQFFVLGIADLDDFKVVNDDLGHDMGDMVLSETATELNAMCRHDDDLVCRYGGDEFIFFMRQPTALASVEIRLNGAIKNISALLQELNCQRGNVGVTAAIESFRADDKRSLDQMLQVIDKQLYEQKQNSKARRQRGVHLVSE